jgi:hypothetical protein
MTHGEGGSYRMIDGKKVLINRTIDPRETPSLPVGNPLVPPPVTEEEIPDA